MAHDIPAMPERTVPAWHGLDKEREELARKLRLEELYRQLAAFQGWGIQSYIEEIKAEIAELEGRQDG